MLASPYSIALAELPACLLEKDYPKEGGLDAK